MTANSETTRLLVTGAAGFVGRHVSDAVAGGAFGATTMISPPEHWDIRDASAVESLVADELPDHVLHLAAQSFVPRSFEDPRETFDVNLMGTLNLLVALKKMGFGGRLVYVSSGDVYGRVPESALPVDELRTPEPLSPYAASKIAAEQLCLQWRRAEKFDVVIARPFNHIGVGQAAQFVLPSLAAQVVAIARGQKPPVIDAGDLDTTRDFTDVRDIVRAYAAMMRDGLDGQTYVVGSGVERRIRDLLSMMCRIMRIEPEIRQASDRMRAVEQRRMVANPGRLTQDTGWVPTIPIEQTLNDILNQPNQEI